MQDFHLKMGNSTQKMEIRNISKLSMSSPTQKKMVTQNH